MIDGLKIGVKVVNIFQDCCFSCIIAIRVVFLHRNGFSH